MNKSRINRYTCLSLFADILGNLTRRSTPYLITWEAKYTEDITVSRQAQEQQHNTPISDYNTQGLANMEFYQPCTVTKVTPSDENKSLDRGGMDGSSDLMPS